MPLLYIKENTTVGELKRFLSDIPDESNIFTGELLIRFDNYTVDNKTHELYIKSV